jgi:hypothetical protein
MWSLALTRDRGESFAAARALARARRLRDAACETDVARYPARFGGRLLLSRVHFGETQPHTVLATCGGCCPFAHRPCHAEGQGFEPLSSAPPKPPGNGGFPLTSVRQLISPVANSQPLVSLSQSGRFPAPRRTVSRRGSDLKEAGPVLPVDRSTLGMTVPNGRRHGRGHEGARTGDRTVERRGP